MLIAGAKKELLEQGKTKARIARMSGISRARVTQVMNLLNLQPEIQKYMNRMGHNLDAKLITERRLREISLIQDSNEQLRAFRNLLSQLP